MTVTGADAATPAAGDCTPGRHPHAITEETATRLAAVLKALADPLRLRMLSVVSASPAGEVCVCDLVTVADVSQPTVSHHLKVLRGAGLLTSQRRGTWVWYRVDPAARRTVAALLESFAPTVQQKEQP